MKKTYKPLVAGIFFISGFIFCTSALGQKEFKHDTNYYETFPDKINVRLFLSQKYIHLNIPSNGNTSDLEYKANPKLNLGAGFSYRGVSLSVFNGFSFLNKNKEDRGKTKGVNLQLHLYPKKWAVDVLAEFPKGFHLEPAGVAGAGTGKYYYREDIKSNLFGVSVYRVPNKEKFSYRAAVLQTEWQKKSAGSFLFGGGVFHGLMQGDSALIPGALSSIYPQTGVKKISFTSVGPGVGYAHTFVFDQHFYITGSMIFNANLNFVSEDGAKKESKVSFNGSDVFKAALGYNSPTWNVSANWAGNGIWIKGSTTNENYFFPSGLVRVVLAHKFTVHKHHS